MHEEALLRDLRRKVRELAPAGGTVRIVRVRLWVGALAHVTPGSIRRRWPEVVADTSAAECQLEIDLSTDPSDPAAQRVRLVEMTADNRPGGVG